MKYSHYLSAAEQDAPDNLKGSFLQYKKLKKTLKRCKYVALASVSVSY